MAVLEALKFGLIQLGSDIPSLRETVVAGRTGFLLPISGSNIWSDTIRDLLNNPGKRLEMRRESWEHAKEFDLDRIAERYERVFEEVVRGSSQQSAISNQ